MLFYLNINYWNFTIVPDVNISQYEAFQFYHSILYGCSHLPWKGHVEWLFGASQWLSRKSWSNLNGNNYNTAFFIQAENVIFIISEDIVVNSSLILRFRVQSDLVGSLQNQYYNTYYIFLVILYLQHWHLLNTHLLIFHIKLNLHLLLQNGL